MPMPLPRESVKTVVFPVGTGPAIVPVRLSRGDQSKMRVVAWQANDVGPNIWVFEGVMSLTQCQAAIAAAGPVDGVNVGVAVCEWPLDDDTYNLTAFCEIAVAAPNSQSVTLVLNEFTRER